MNVLSQSEKLAVVEGLLEGASIRSVERMTGIHRDTITRLMIKTGERCREVMGRVMQGLTCHSLQLDEIWTFVGKKQHHLQPGERTESNGDQFIFVALDAKSRLIPHYKVGKRTSVVTYEFLKELHSRLAKYANPQITTDGFHGYLQTVSMIFGTRADYATLVKHYEDDDQHEHRYAPPRVTEVVSKVISGNPVPELVSTSYVERHNLQMRTCIRRFTRLTNAFSKKLENLEAALALYFAHYNLCKIHGTLGVTPAMAAGVRLEPLPIQHLLA